MEGSMPQDHNQPGASTRPQSPAVDNGAPELPRSRKLPSSRYKGVVPQANGRWGAQIYENNHRVWLGTFNLEEEAARAYDVASQRFRGHNAVTNFNPLSSTTPDGSAGIEFLSSHSKAEIVDMLRKHTYQDELEQSMRRFTGRMLITGSSSNYNDRDHVDAAMIIDEAATHRQRFSERPDREQLFEKVVTPSDAGKLNRFVIPKQHAEKHFPIPRTGGSMIPTPPPDNGFLLNFEDPHGKVWRFRYSYWESSQSYVLTKGWSRFVKETKLKAGDAVCFQKSTGPDGKLYIDWRRKNEIVPAWMDGRQQESDKSRRQGRVLRLFGVDVCSSSGSTT